MKWNQLITLAVMAIFITACAKSPTGRSQLKLYSSDQLAEMGKQAFDSMKSEQKVSSQPVQNDYVTCVARHVAAQVSKEVYNGQWEVVVFDEPQVNAFALPGGKIGVYTGLLNVAENQHQLAAVIGHEVGHVIAEHGNERMSNSALIGIGMQATQQILQANEVGNSNMIMAALGISIKGFVELPFSRTHETEADVIGLQLMAKAGFDPRQSVNLWQNMDKAGGQRSPEWLSTHPAPSSRIEKLQKNMPGALKAYKQAPNKPNCR
ncbi:Metalloendopeptidase OMA1, mitochondrial [Saliniradius amylolyticus]|uniref:Metalloendopeptidase OMA1, mitochondrial n=1 Tax=Saliniradius amylolyticus TaxID=2183582 RepID=A0A2S2E0D7_9ALTE|nr:M48 family metallopeptidase [Saliniradius amylolyticus]AWL11115.1 Metalloendopeptidase OMA1, mitochondrial [Saliniradius amylolyticus]